MFVSYKSQSTGNQGEASDIITFYITQVASLPHGREGQLKTPPSTQQDEEDSWRLPSPVQPAWAQAIPALLAHGSH